jgi:hypothetical protein
VQNAVGGGAQEKRETMSTMASNDDEIGILALRYALNLALWSTEDEILPLGRNCQRRGELGQMRLRLVMDLILHTRKIHGDVAAVGKTQRFYYMHDAEIGIERIR